MNCSSCGSLLPAGAQICPICGTRTPTAYANSGTSSSDPTVISSLPAYQRDVASSHDPTLPAQSVEGTSESATTGNAPYPYESRPVSSGQPHPYTPIPHTSYSYGPPPPPPDPYNVRPVGPQIPYTPPPIFANQRSQEPPRRRGRGGLIALLLLLIVLLIGGSAFVYFNHVQQENLAHTQATATANAQREATSTAVMQASATAHVQATATAAAANPYTAAGTLLFTDTLKDNSQGHKWDENTNCAFKNGTYHAIAPTPAFGDYCIAQGTDLTNFIFEVEMKILKGDGGGIDFRSANTETENHYYDFYVFQDGNYSLDLVSGSTSKTLTNGSSVAIKQGLNQTNILAIVAQGTLLKVYVNHQQVTSIDDSTYKHGPVGVEANPLATGGHQTEVEYSNAKVWTL